MYPQKNNKYFKCMAFEDFSRFLTKNSKIIDHFYSDTSPKTRKNNLAVFIL